MVLNFDLNYPLCEESFASFDPQGVTTETSKGLFGSPIDVEETDEEVVLIPSSSTFPKRKTKRRRNHQPTIDLEQAREKRPVQPGAAEILLSLASDINNENTSANINNVSHQDCVDLEKDDYSKLQWQRKSARTPCHVDTPGVMMTSPLPQPPPSPPREEPSFNCPLCMDPYTRPCSTVCGHIFCLTCIEACIAASVKNKARRQCPICRVKLPAKKSFHRVYLPFVDE